MRQALAKFNEGRLAKNQSPLNIGMGLHYGEAIAGTIGSEERLEYTVIGDTVNTGSRIEASTKAFGVDLLLSQEVATAVKDKFLLAEAGKVKVKGKEDGLTLFRVDGYMDEGGKPVLVQTPYSSYAAEAADKVKVNA